jgi:glycosyltransferase involved in cell wall biosynthesis
MIPVYNDWEILSNCLASLAKQDQSPPFEVIVVDDGSWFPTPTYIRDRFLAYPFVVIAIRQEHSGVSMARNRALRRASGQVFLFVDADCILDANCLRALETALEKYPSDDSFQLRIAGRTRDTVGIAEDLHLTTVQNQRLESDGHILYMNTSGMALRRRKVDIRRGVFNAGALRAQDSLLLAELVAGGKPPRFLSEAVVTHAVNLPPLQYLVKGLAAGYLAEKTYMFIDEMGVSIRASAWQRCSMLATIVKQLRQHPIWGLAVVVMLLRRLLYFVGSFAFRLRHPKINVLEFKRETEMG